MVSFLNDSKEWQFLDRIRCITYREIQNEMIARMGDPFITRQWISKKLHHDESCVRRTWNKTTEECYTQFGSGRPTMSSQESENIIASADGARGAAL